MISIIACLGKKNRAIGKDNKLLWDIPEDLEHFKKITLNHPVIMGENTFLSIGHPLPERFNIVIGQSKEFSEKENLKQVGSFNEALEKASKINEDEIFIIGGGQVYAQAIDKADRLYLTLIEDEKVGDTFFPPYEEKFKKIEESRSSLDDLDYSFTVWEK